VSSQQALDAVTLTLNPALDRTLQIPGFLAGAVNRVERERSAPGGKGINVAACLADYGLSVAVSGFLGRDNVAPFASLFAEKNIHDHCLRIAGSTRTGIKITDPESRQTTDINFPGLAPTRDELKVLLDELARLQARFFVLAGSVPYGVPDGVYATLIASLRERGQRVVCDTSGVPLARAIEAMPHAIKPNLHELETLFGEQLHDERAVIRKAQALCDAGIELVVVSMGKAGACFVRGGAVAVATPPEMEVESTVGAGDAMVAGLLAAELAGLPLAESARLATAFSVVALSRPGPRACNRDTVERALAQVSVR